jgi:hypothetical protein
VLVIAQKLVEQALSTNIRALLAASLSLSAPAAFALLDFNTQGMLVKPTNLLQFAPHPSPTRSKPFTYNVIVPYKIGVPPVFPLPTWRERVFAPRFYASARWSH